MFWPRELPEAYRLSARAITYQYRYCPRCRLEWSAKHQSCPECVHWLGDRPLERTEWQLAPTKRSFAAPQTYDLVNAGAFVLRILRDDPPTDEQAVELARVIAGAVAPADAAVCGIPKQGWLIWSKNGLRRALQTGRQIEQKLIASLPQFEQILHHSGRVRWGLWIDQYMFAFDARNRPVLNDITANAIFNFEPDNMLLVSEAMYKANRSWEHFLGAPRRLLDGQEPFGYRMAGHKRPSALDHAEAADLSPFVGRKRELSLLEDCWKNAGSTVELALTAPAGSGKTRLIKEWLRRHSELRALAANFSLFGGGVVEFAGQLANLPSDRLDSESLVEAVADRVRRERINVLVLDDLHWADTAGLEFLQALLAALATAGMFTILAARPSGHRQLKTLKPSVELKLSSLPKAAVEEMARQLTNSEPIAAAATLRSKGNPLFVEQFTAWAAEANFRGGSSGPHTLYQIIAGRIEHLSKVRIADIRQRLRWGGSWERQAIGKELGQLEAEVGRWLDRLETGDYGDRVEAARHLVHLERLDYEIFLTSMLLGRPRPRSSRLREAIERLLIGSAEEILADLKRRSKNATAATKENVSREARWAADILFAAFNWRLAKEFYQLAYAGALWERDEIDRRLAQCRRHSLDVISDDDEVYSALPSQDLNDNPHVDALDLPYVWADLGRRSFCSVYFMRASKAAKAIGDRALAAWAECKAEELPANHKALPRS